MTTGIKLGLCADCAHARRVRSNRGSEFLRCAKAETASQFPRYPTLPVRECAGHRPGVKPGKRA